MKQIQSRSNPVFQEMLAQFKVAGRPGHPVFLEGPHLCETWLALRGQPSWLVFARDQAEQPDVLALRQRVDWDRQIELVTALFDGLSSVKTPQGVLFVVEPIEPTESVDLTQTTVMLEQVQDPGNVGTILRTCAAASVSQVVTSRGTASCWSPKVLRSAQGAHFSLQIHEGQDLSGLLTAHRHNRERAPVLATALDGAEPLFATMLPTKAIWLFGNEGQGLTDGLLALADQRLRIDIDSHAVESLNVGSAVAVCLFEQRRQNQLQKSVQ